MKIIRKLQSSVRPAAGIALAGFIALPDPALAFMPKLTTLPELDLWSVEDFADLGIEDLFTAQVDGGYGNDNANDSTREDRDTSRASTPAPLSDARTAKIVGVINDGMDLCEHLPWDYRLDCLYHVIDRAAKATPAGVDYEPVKKALEKAAKRLDRVRRKHAAPDGDAKAFRAADGTTTPPLMPVRREDRAAVIRETDAILEETQTILLRSAGDDAEELEQFTRVVQAVDSTKLLLRSA